MPALCPQGPRGHPKDLLSQKKSRSLCHFPKAPRWMVAGIQFIKQESLLFWVFACVSHFPTRSHESWRSRPNHSPPRVFAAKGSPRKTGGSSRLSPLALTPRWPQEPTIPEAVDLQLPQNIRLTVCAPSANLSLFGNKPRCNPLETTKGRRVQM